MRAVAQEVANDVAEGHKFPGCTFVNVKGGNFSTSGVLDEKGVTTGPVTVECLPKFDGKFRPTGFVETLVQAVETTKKKRTLVERSFIPEMCLYRFPRITGD